MIYTKSIHAPVQVRYEPLKTWFGTGDGMEDEYMVLPFGYGIKAHRISLPVIHEEKDGGIASGKYQSKK